MTDRYDAIVIGVGTMGSAACYQLARRGARVLGLDRFDIPNTMSSHHGHSRMFRIAYFEHPDYVRLLQRAYVLWRELEAASGQSIFHEVGALYVGRPSSELVSGSIAAARQYDLPHEVFGKDELHRRYPQFRVPDDSIAFFESQAGYVIPEKAVSANATLALRHGAVLKGHHRVLGWSADDKGVAVTTTETIFYADRLVVSGGAWSAGLLGDLAPPLAVTRQAMGWFWPRRPELFAEGRLPCWGIDLAPPEEYRGVHYGFPMTPDHPGFKAALHWPAEEADPDTLDREPRPDDEQAIRDGLTRYLPDADGPLINLRVCCYTNTPDGHFILDGHPHHDRVTIACGFSGHGFKFAPVIGEALADLTINGETDPPIDFLRLGRFEDASPA